MIRNALATDSAAIATIYNHYIDHTAITFELDPITADEINRRIEKTQSAELPFIVAEHNGQVIGYAYASPWRDRLAYQNSVETSVYLDHQLMSKGWGSKLYQALFDQLKQLNLHIAIGGITLPNPASIALHEKFGMHKVAHFEEVGYKFEQWLDVGYWQVNLKTLES